MTAASYMSDSKTCSNVCWTFHNHVFFLATEMRISHQRICVQEANCVPGYLGW